MTTKREHPRIYLSLPMECQVRVAESPQSWDSRAILKNISRGGLYFECETLPQIQRGNVVELSFTTEPAKFCFVNSPIKAQVLIKRIEPGVAGTTNYGVAVEFLEGVLFT